MENKTVQTVEFNANHDYTKWKTKTVENKTVQTVEFNANHDYTKWKTKQSKLLSSTLTMTIPNGKQNSPNCFNANQLYQMKTKQSKLLSSTLTMTIPNGKQNSPNC